MADDEKPKEPKDPVVKDLEDRLARAEAARKLAAEELELLKAKRALAAGEKPEDAELAELDRRSKLAEAEQKTAKAEADALKEKFIGQTTAGPFSGDVTVKEGSGLTEGALLAAQAVRAAAAVVARGIPADSKRVLLFTESSRPRFQRLLMFRLRERIIRQAYKDAGVETARPGEEAFTLGVAAAAVEAIRGILGFFKTEFTVGGAQVALSETLLLGSVAESLIAGERHVSLPGVFTPPSNASELDSISQTLTELTALRIAAESDIEKLDQEVKELEKAAAAAKDLEKAAAAATVTEPVKAKAARIRAVISLHDAFSTSLAAVDAAGETAAAALIQEGRLEKELKDATVVLVKLEHGGAGYFIKKNIWTSLGGMPLYFMGGATVSYFCLSGNDGKTVAAGVVPVHGGFVKASRVKQSLETSMRGSASTHEGKEKGNGRDVSN